ncbi:MAG: GC-type dockerin domain-anchored protein [Planctomyces sp.]|jgi:hypothetical protein
MLDHQTQRPWQRVAATSLGVLALCGTASAQEYNRQIVPSELRVEHVALGNGSVGPAIVAAVALSSSLAEPVDLSTVLSVSIDGVEVLGPGVPVVPGWPSPTTKIIVGPGIPGPPGGPAICEPFCIQTCRGGLCYALNPSHCLCMTEDEFKPRYGPGYRLILPLTVVPAPGTVITATLRAADPTPPSGGEPGSTPAAEINTLDDSATFIDPGPALCAADIANTDGEAGSDGVVDNGDFSAFFNAFFLDAGDAARAIADIADTDGTAGADGSVDNGDFSLFFASFFGCGAAAG